MSRVFQNVSCFVVLLSTAFLTSPTSAQTTTDDILTPAEWQSIDSSVERALSYLAKKQQSNGSFETHPLGQPGVTSLCVMAFASHGHMPGDGPYGEQLQKALDFIISCQKDNGIIALVMPSSKRISRNVKHEIGSTSAYNHALSALVVSEVFAMGGGDLEKSQAAVESAVQATLAMQRWPKRRNEDIGGWRYINRFTDRYDSDLSVAGWNLMSLRSAKNAGFDIPKKPIDDAVGYVRRCFQPRFNTFTIMASNEDRRSRGMAGAGILALSHAGLHDSKEARTAGDWLLKEMFANYNESRRYAPTGWVDDRYHYGVFCASQAMYQLGDKYWEKFYPPTIRVILKNQDPDGSWKPESHTADRMYGEAYTTALMTLTLGTPNQLLPIFQR